MTEAGSSTTGLPRPAFRRRHTLTICSAFACSWLGCVSLKSGDVEAPSNDPSSLDGSLEPQGDEHTTGATADVDAAPDVSTSDDSSIADGPSMTDGPSMDSGDENTSPYEASDMPPSPASIATSHLGLWLTASAGISCASGRITVWKDQSGHRDDATLQRGQLGPECQVTPKPHVANGVDLPYFSAPISASHPNVLDETLDVDLSFLANTDYTIFAVERRWADYAINASVRDEELILGTTMPLALESSNPMVCAAEYENNALFIGYVYYDQNIGFALDQDCNTLIANADMVPSTPPGALTEHTVEFDVGRGHEIWTNGIPENASAETSPLAEASGGAIGRALLQTMTTGVDPRFRGDIAEVVVYDAALEDGDRSAIEAYLRDRWQNGPSSL
jgi:hypothetical protein